MTNNLYKTIMKNVSKNVIDALNEFDDIKPKNIEFSGEQYIINCDGINKKILNNITDKLPAFNSYSQESIQIICKTHNEVNKVIALLVNMNVLDTDNSFSKKPIITIRKINKNFINDSINESRRSKTPEDIIGIGVRTKIKKDEIKRDIIKHILRGEIKRDEDTIKYYLVASGKWFEIGDKYLQYDTNVIMKKTEPQPEIEGQFITDYIYSKYDSESFSPIDAAENHIKWLLNKGMDIEIVEGRYSFKYYITYKNRVEYEYLVNWLAWHLGMIESINNEVRGSDRKETEEIIASGKSLIWR